MPFSTTDTEEGALNGHDSTTDAKESVRSCDDATADAAKGIETQVLSPADAEEYILSCDDWTMDDEEDIDAMPFSIPDAAKGIETQVLSPADAEESVRACDNSTDEDEEDIDAMPFSTTDTEEGALNGHDSTTDAAKDIETQALSIPDAAGSLGALPFSAAKGRWGVRSPRGPDPPTDDGHDSTDTGNDFADTENNFSADRHPPAAVGTALAADSQIFPADECRPLHTLTEKHPYLNPSFHEPHPLLRLHPPSFGGFGRTFRVQSVQPPFGRPFLGRFVDIRPACTVGSRPLRPRLARCRPEHPDRERTTSANAVERFANAVSTPADAAEHGAQCAKNADFIDVDPVRGHKIERNAPEHADDERKRHDSAPERFANAIRPAANAPEHGAQCAKNADFIDADPVRGHKIDRNESEHRADAGEHPADEHKTDRDESEHPDRGRKRHDPAPEHPACGHKIERNVPEHRADECPDPAYDLDAGQRVLRSAAHRRAVRAEREACCGALRHLAHCCVAF